MTVDLMKLFIFFLLTMFFGMAFVQMFVFQMAPLLQPQPPQPPPLPVPVEPVTPRPTIQIPIEPYTGVTITKIRRNPHRFSRAS
jgi:hypothetical protein